MISRTTASFLMALAYFSAAAAEPNRKSTLMPGQHWTSGSHGFQVQIDSSLQPVQINRIHHWTIHLQDADGRPMVDAVLELEGGMPGHNHGLPTRPRVSAEKGGRYRLDGLRFHMPGEWELKLTIRAGELTDSILIPLRL